MLQNIKKVMSKDTSKSENVHVISLLYRLTDI
jgi:hypothetical protein